MRVLAVIFGVLLLLPGLCFLGFGASFTFSGYGMTAFGLLELAVGGLITWGAVLLIINYSKPRQPVAMRAFGMVLVTLGGLLLLPGLCFLAFRSLWGPDPGYFITGIALVAVAAGFLLRFFGNRD